MATDPSQNVDHDLIVKADKLAGDLAEILKCDAVYISLSSKERLFAFGLSQPDAPKPRDRVLDAAISICAETVERNAPTTFHDLRRIDKLKNRPVVRKGCVVGYMGRPIRDEVGNAVGAICATTKVPRIWSQAERTMLRNAGEEAELLLATEGLKRENQTLSQALGEYDGIVGAIAKHADAMISIHANSGALIFATNALLHQMDPSALEDMIRQTRDMGKVHDMSGLQEPRALWVSAGGTPHWRPVIERHSGSLTFVQWVPETPDNTTG